MSKCFTFQCDNCEEHGDAKWNGEHWLPPPNWMTLVDKETGRTVDMHLCDGCKPEVEEPQ